MSLISINHLTFYYEGSFDTIFEDVSFQLDTDWKLGFIARNGRGKTTFLNLLMGKYEYKGSIHTGEAFDYFPFAIEDANRNTLDIVESIYPDNEFWKICRELSLLEMETDVLYRPFATLSNGEQTKIMLAVLFSMDNRFLLIDEPTNHLDMPTRTVVREYLKQKKGFILVSHDRDFLDESVDHVLVINKTNIEVYQGNFTTWWENKHRQDAFELAENEKLKKEIRHLTESARRTAGWSDQIEKSKIGNHVADRGFIGHKSVKMMKRAKVIESHKESAIEKKSTLLKNIETADRLKILPLTHHKEVLIRMEDVSIRYPAVHSLSISEAGPDNSLQQGIRILPKIDMGIKNGDRIVLAGKNGCGKSSIIKVLLQAGGVMDHQICYEGRIETASGLKFSYVSQDTSHLNGSLMEYAKSKGLDETLFLSILRKLDFSRIQFEKNMEDYSGGQKKKVLLAGSLCEQAHLYIWDEPLNYIDIFSRMQIEELILQFKPTMLLVEHDKNFVDRIATDIINL